MAILSWYQVAVCSLSVLSLLGTPTTPIYRNMTLWSQVLVLLSDTGQHGQTLPSVPKHSQTSQDAAKTLGSVWHHAGPTNYTKMLRSIFWAPESRARAISEGKVSRISRSIRSTGLRFQFGGWRQGAKPLDIDFAPGDEFGSQYHQRRECYLGLQCPRLHWNSNRKPTPQPPWRPSVIRAFSRGSVGHWDVGTASHWGSP